jgi:hypothetical protein
MTKTIKGKNGATTTATGRNPKRKSGSTKKDGGDYSSSSDVDDASASYVTPHKSKAIDRRRKKRKKVSIRPRPPIVPTSQVHRGAVGVKEVVAGMTNDPSALKKKIVQILEQQKEAEQERNLNEHMRRPGARRWKTVRNIGNSDPQAQQIITVFAKGLYSVQKFLYKNWDVVSTKRNSVYQLLKHMMIKKGKIYAPPGGLSWPEYYTSTLCKPLFYKVGNIRNQKLQKMRNAVKGESVTLSSIRVVLPIHFVAKPTSPARATIMCLQCVHNAKVSQV